MKVVEVAVGVILKDNQVFICKRADDLHQGGKYFSRACKMNKNSRSNEKTYKTKKSTCLSEKDIVDDVVDSL